MEIIYDPIFMDASHQPPLVICHPMIRANWFQKLCNDVATVQRVATQSEEWRAVIKELSGTERRCRMSSYRENNIFSLSCHTHLSRVCRVKNLFRWEGLVFSLGWNTRNERRETRHLRLILNLVFPHLMLAKGERENSNNVGGKATRREREKSDEESVEISERRRQ